MAACALTFGLNVLMHVPHFMQFEVVPVYFYSNETCYVEKLTCMTQAITWEAYGYIYLVS